MKLKVPFPRNDVAGLAWVCVLDEVREVGP